MSILRRLIVKEWFKAFSISSFALLLVVTAANLVAGFLRVRITAPEVFYSYLLELPSFFTRILPVACLTASLFCINKLKNSHELVAILASGFPRRKFIETIFMCASIIALVQFINSGFIKPSVLSMRNTLIQDPDTKFSNLRPKGLKSKTIGSGSIWYKGQYYYVSFPLYQRESKKLFDINIYYFINSHRIARRIHADVLIFDDTKQLWMGDTVTDIERVSEDDLFPTITKTFNSPVALLERPEDFDQIESDISVLNVFQLGAYVAKLEEAGIDVNDFLVLYLEQYASSFMCLIFALVSGMGILTPNRRTRSLGREITLAFIFTVVYWVVFSYCLELGRNSKINAYAACFSVPSIFSLLLLLAYRRRRRLPKGIASLKNPP